MTTPRIADFVLQDSRLDATCDVKIASRLRNVPVAQIKTDGKSLVIRKDSVRGKQTLLIEDGAPLRIERPGEAIRDATLEDVNAFFANVQVRLPPDHWLPNAKVMRKLKQPAFDVLNDPALRRLLMRKTLNLRRMAEMSGPSRENASLLEIVKQLDAYGVIDHFVKQTHDTNDALECYLTRYPVPYRNIRAPFATPATTGDTELCCLLCARDGQDAAVRLIDYRVQGHCLSLAPVSSTLDRAIRVLGPDAFVDYLLHESEMQGYADADAFLRAYDTWFTWANPEDDALLNPHVGRDVANALGRGFQPWTRPDEQPAEEAPAGTIVGNDAVTYEVVASSFNDAVIRRRTIKTSHIMALLPSRRQFYIRNEGTGDTAPLTSKNVNDFLRYMDRRDALKPVPWLPRLEPNTNIANLICDMTSDEQICANIAAGVVCMFANECERKESTSLTIRRLKQTDARSRTFKTMLKTVLRFVDRRSIARVLSCKARYANTDNVAKRAAQLLRYADELVEVWGTDGAQTFAATWLCAPDSKTAREPHLSYLFAEDRIEMFSRGAPDVKRFARYLAEQPELQQNNVIDDNASFLNMLGDTLYMQWQIHHEIVDWCPTHLVHAHDQLRVELECVKNKEYDDMVRERAQALTPLAEARGDYCVRAPNGVEEIVEEGRRQRHCIASYVRRHAYATTTLFFVRRRDEPDKNLIDIEIEKGTLLQIHGTFNRPPTEPERTWVTDWMARNEKALTQLT